MKSKLILLILSVLSISNLMAADVTIWFGNIGNEPIIADNDTEIVIPVSIYSKPDVVIAAVHIPLSSNDNYISERLEPIVHAPFSRDIPPPEGYDKGWDVASTLDPIPHTDLDGYTSQSLLGFCDLTRKPNTYLTCPDTCMVLEFPMKLSVPDSMVGDTCDMFIEGFQGPSRGLHFSDITGAVTFEHEAFFSKVFIVKRGDVNGDRKINRKDVEHLKKYFKGRAIIPWPIERADYNKDLIVDKDDIKELAEMLR